MIDNFIVTQTNNLLTLTRPEGRGGTFRLGEVLTADVLDVIESGMVTLRITPPVGRGLEGQGKGLDTTGGEPQSGGLETRGAETRGAETRGAMLVRARTSVPMDKGDRVLLEVMGADKDVRLKFLGVSTGREAEAAAPPQGGPPSVEQKIQTLMGELSGSKLSVPQFKGLQEVFAKLPESLKNAFPIFRALEAALPEIEKLNAGMFKNAVEDTGVLFETRLKFATAQNSPQAQNNPPTQNAPPTDDAASPDDLAAELLKGASGGPDTFKTDSDAGDGSPASNFSKKGQERNAQLNRRDLKAVLLKARELLKNEKVLETLKHSGLDPKEINTAVDKLIKNIEFFQLTSRANDMIYTFLPFSWNELKDGELVFKKNKYYGKKSYTCDMNLDLEHLGKISISTTAYEGEFFVSFNAEKEETRNLLEKNKSALAGKFKAVGLALKAVNVSLKKEVDFNTVIKEKEGLHLTI
jgi:hypothetical protein